MALLMFIDNRPFNGSVQQKEELASVIKSHAARVAHLKRPCRRYKRKDDKDLQRKQEQIVTIESDDHEVLRSPSSKLIISPNVELDELGKIFWKVSALSSAQYCKALKTRTIFTHEWLDLLHDDAFFHVGSALIKYEYGELVDPTLVQPEVIDHKLKALSIIRRRIKESDGILDNPTLLSIVFLPTLENIFNANKPDNAHWQALGELLKARMRVRPLTDGPYGRYTVDVINQHHSFALFHAGLDILEGVDLDLKSLSPKSSKAAKSPGSSESDREALMPRGFQVLQNQGRIGKATTDLVHNLLTILEDQMCGRYGEHHPQPDKSAAMSSSFMHTWGLFDLTASSISDEPSIEDVLTAAVTMYTSRVVAGPLRSVSVVARAAETHLVSKLMLCALPRPYEEDIALFWSWIVAIEACKTRLDDLSPEGLQLRDMFVARFEWLYQLRTATKSTLKQFFCDENFWNDYKTLVLRI